MKEPMLKKAMDTLEFLSQNEAARMAYDARMKALSDEKSRIEGAMEAGRAAGIAAGIAAGKAEGKAETAVKMLELGIDVETISKATGFSVEEIKAMRPRNPNIYPDRVFKHMAGEVMLFDRITVLYGNPKCAPPVPVY
ncbi:hypothetical protein [Paenibacillus sp. YYML68]|uniref:hypothetical protein n=1 Tax=Paenibacillus sp. YYML68 TaxID=2909250 RepID=UPI0024902455|nr:hypothetical protein [Paenibacillus sp. YYML68]